MEVVDALLGWLARKGADSYDEWVTQTEHALQTAQLARHGEADAPAIAAALLHDVGHLLMNEPRPGEPDRRHEEVGARFLANWFGPEVTTPVRLHVPAKRYLCAVEPTYEGGLSDASAESLRVQGGAMSPEEVEAFRATPHYESGVALRRWDDAAKVVDADAGTLDDHRELLIGLVESVPLTLSNRAGTAG